MLQPQGRYPFSELAPGVFFFTTDSGIYYTVEISNSSERFNGNTLLCNSGKVFEISFDNNSSNDIGHDGSVSETILHIIVTNILARGDISIYFFVCDTTDDKGKLRARLFNIWFLKIIKHIPSLFKADFQIPGFDGEEFDISLLLYKNHPNFENYRTEFEKCLDDNFNKTRYDSTSFCP